MFRINQCAVCRIAVVERSQPGGGRKMQTMAVDTRSAVPLAGEGQARVLTENPAAEGGPGPRRLSYSLRFH